METIINCRRIVTPTEVISGHIVVKDGMISDVATGPSQVSGALDWTDEILTPGLIDIHTDNLEKHYMPRPGARWDRFGAALAHDGQMATAGVTTVLDSLSLHGRSTHGLDRSEALADLIGALEDAERAEALRVDHKLHLRCEVTNPGLFDLLETHLLTDRLQMLSVMDHTPGARFPGGLEAVKEKWRGQGKTEEEIQQRLDRQGDWRDSSLATERRAGVASLGQEHGLPVASHDDGMEEHIDEAKALGCTIAEFPITLEAAARATEVGLVNVMGAPNFVRGRSHGDNLSARGLAENGKLDALCSDYVPQSMIRAAFMLTEAPFHWSLSEALETVTAAPAKMSNLLDRGEISVGKRADILRVAQVDTSWPLIREVWRTGERVA